MNSAERRHIWSETAHRIEDLFGPDPDDGAPGLVFGAMVGGEPVIRGHRGLAVIEHAIPLAADTRLRIGSVSKHFACALALLLEKEGALSLEDKVGRHLPVAAGGPVWGERVSVRQLCNNTSGAADFIEGLHLSGAGVLQPSTSAQCAELTFSQPHLNCRPGSRLVYSAGGFLTLCLLLERVVEQPMHQLLRDRLFGPAGMKDTGLISSDTAVVARMANPYVLGPEGTLLRGGWGLELNCEGGIVSTLDDMLAWTKWLLRDPVGARLLSAMSKPASYDSGIEGVYGLGLACVWHNGIRLVGHGGRTPGFRTEMWLVPDADAAAIVIANDNRIATDDLAFEMIMRLFASRLAPPRAANVDWTERSGHYADADGLFCLQLAVGDDGPWLETSSARYRLTPVDDRSFRVAGPLWDAIVDLPADNDRLLLTDSGQPIELLRCRPPVGDVPAELAGDYFNESLATTYHIASAEGETRLRMHGRRGYQDYLLTAISDDVVIATPLGRFASFHRPRLNLVRDRQGSITGVRVSTERTAALPFHRIERRKVHV